MYESVDYRKAVLEAAFRHYEGAPFAIRLWDGWFWQLRDDEKPVFTVIFKSVEALNTLIAFPTENSLGEMFTAGDLDVDGDLFSAFDVSEHILRRSPPAWKHLQERLGELVFNIGRWWQSGRRHSHGRDREAIETHYNQPLGFFEPWLGKTLTYSCAYFRSKQENIDTAQTNKLELICKKLRLKPGEHFLDIGCGWGSLVLYAASRHNADARGITLSSEQAEIAVERIRKASRTQSCSVGILDYRDAVGRLPLFDKIASVGMFEHVGLKNLCSYFSAAYNLLRPGGVFLNHGIARSNNQGAPLKPANSDTGIVINRRHRSIGHLEHSSFVNRHVFPDGELATMSQAVEAAESVGFEVRDVENLREHYELTIRLWVDGMRRHEVALTQLVPERTYRIWLLYLAGSAVAFRRGDLGLYQILLSRPDHGATYLPMTRDDWYVSHERESKEDL